MESEDIRNKISKYVSERGVKYSFIAKEAKINNSTLCHYMKKDNTSEMVEQRLIRFIKDNNL